MSQMNNFALVGNFGLVCSPAEPQRFLLGIKPFLLVPQISTYEIWEADTLRKVFTGPHFENSVEAVCAGNKDTVFTVVGGVFSRCDRLERVFEQPLDLDDEHRCFAIKYFHERHAVVVVTNDGVYIRDSETGIVINRVTGLFGNNLVPIWTWFKSSNDEMKIVMVKRQIEQKIDSLLIVDLKSGKVGQVNLCPNSNSTLRITAMIPAEDESNSLVIAAVINERDPIVMVVDLGLAESEGPLCTFDCCAIVEAMAFVDLAEVSSSRKLLACGCVDGSLMVMDLMNEGEILVKERDTHNKRSTMSSSAPLSCMKAMFSLPVADGDRTSLLATFGTDGSVAIWRVEELTGVSFSLSVVRRKQTLSYPPSLLDFFDDEGRQLLAVANGPDQCLVGFVNVEDRRLINLFEQKKSIRIATKKWRRPLTRLPKINSMYHCSLRRFDWPCLLTCHENLHQVFLWNPTQSKLCAACLELPPEATSPPAKLTATAAVGAVTSVCGHHAVVGYRDGQIHHYNLQSRRWLGSFSVILEDGSRGSPFKGAPVRFLHVSRENKVYSAACHFGDVRLITWDLHTRRVVSSVDLREQLDEQLNNSREYKITKMDFREFWFVASLEDGDGDGLVVLFDLKREGTICRRFRLDLSRGESVSSLKFSPRADWVCLSTSRTLNLLKTETTCADDDASTSDEDSTEGRIMIFDILSARLIEKVSFESPVLTFCFNPSGSHLITSHAASSINPDHSSKLSIWVNKQIFTGDPILFVGDESIMKHKHKVIVMEPCLVNLSPEFGTSRRQFRASDRDGIVVQPQKLKPIPFALDLSKKPQDDDNTLVKHESLKALRAGFGDFSDCLALLKKTADQISKNEASWDTVNRNIQSCVQDFDWVDFMSHNIDKVKTEKLVDTLHLLSASITHTWTSLEADMDKLACYIKFLCHSQFE